MNTIQRKRKECGMPQIDGLMITPMLEIGWTFVHQYPSTDWIDHLSMQKARMIFTLVSARPIHARGALFRNLNINHSRHEILMRGPIGKNPVSN